MEEVNTKLRKDDRILVLRPTGKGALSSTGLVDPRLFTGGNTLHAIMNPIDCLWSMKYEAGIVPQALKGKYTSFNALYKYAKDYLSRRNIEIVEVKD